MSMILSASAAPLPEPIFDEEKRDMVCVSEDSIVGLVISEEDNAVVVVEGCIDRGVSIIDAVDIVDFCVDLMTL